MQNKLARLKPGGSRKTHLLLAAMLWSVAGTILMVRAAFWLVHAHLVVLAVPAVLLGSLKSHLVLDRTAIKSINRILLLEDGACLGAVYSVKTWLLVMGMMSAGILLRHSALPRPWLGLLYATIGWGLLWSSRLGWQAWRRGYGNAI